MARSVFAWSLILCAILLIVMPVGALYSLTDVTTYPAMTVVQPGDPLQLSALARIIPQGSTTYIEGYTLVLSTELERPSWQVIVTVDGRDAAVFQKTSQTVFISGYLLSYPTTQDVNVKISLEGIAPHLEPGSSFILLRVTELNNQGLAVPGSVQTVTGTMVHPSQEPSQTGPVLTTTVTRPGPTNAGDDPVLLIGFLCLAVVLASAGKMK